MGSGESFRTRDTWVPKDGEMMASALKHGGIVTGPTGTEAKGSTSGDSSSRGSDPGSSAWDSEVEPFPDVVSTFTHKSLTQR